MSLEDTNDVRDIDRHDFRSVLLHPMLYNANRDMNGMQKRPSSCLKLTTAISYKRSKLYTVLLRPQKTKDAKLVLVKKGLAFVQQKLKEGSNKRIGT